MSGGWGPPGRDDPRERRGQTLVIPPPAAEITPETARSWLREKLGAYMEIAAAGALADALDTREALHFLVLDVRAIADACVIAAVTGQTVRLELTEREDDPHNFDDETAILRAVVGARELVRRKWCDSEAIDQVFEELAQALAERERERELFGPR
jgi:hypothetical protein